MSRFDAKHRANLSKAIAATKARQHAERLEDVQFMADTGECLTGAAERLGLSHQALDHWTRRHAAELRMTLLSREPIGYSEWRKVS